MVQENTSGMPRALGKRLSNQPKRYGIYEMESGVGRGRSRRGASNNGAARASFQTHNNTWGREPEGNDTDDDLSQSEQFYPSESERMDDYISEWEKGIDNNSKNIQYVSDNVSAVLKVLWQVLPLSTVQLFNEQVKSSNSAEHEWAQDLSYQRLGPGGNTDADQGKNTTVTIDMATSTATASSPAAPQAGTNYASVVASPTNASNQTDLNKLIRDNLEDMHRKKNIIIAGMDEEYDDDVLVRNMFGVMGCGFLYRDINKRPTRLGMKNNIRPRALKVEMNNEEAVEVIMKCKKELRNRNENFYRIYINRDLRKEEREKEIAQRKARNSRIFGDSAAGAGENIDIATNLGGTQSQQSTPSSGQGGAPSHQTTPSNEQREVARTTPINETGTDLPPTTEGNIGEIDIEDGVVIETVGDDTSTANNQVEDESDTGGVMVDSTEGGGGSSQNPNQDNISNSDQVSNENDLGNGDGMSGPIQT